jgi:hypothetical protein
MATALGIREPPSFTSTYGELPCEEFQEISRREALTACYRPLAYRPAGWACWAGVTDLWDEILGRP